MRNILRGAITFMALLVVGALILGLSRRVPWITTVITGLVTAFLLVGSVVKLWRAVRYGDFSVTSNTFWLPKRVRSWMHPELYEKKQAPPRQGQNSN
jgi:hypothetical protein